MVIRAVTHLTDKYSVSITYIRIASFEVPSAHKGVDKLAQDNKLQRGLFDKKQDDKLQSAVVAQIKKIA